MAVVVRILLSEAAVKANIFVVAHSLLAEAAVGANNLVAEVGVQANTQHGAHMNHVRVRCVCLRM